MHEHGSLGCSGDLAPLAHCALALTGEGAGHRRARPPRSTPPTALRDAGLQPVELREKEGLALINGTDGMLGMLVLAIADLRELLATADVAAAMSVEGLLGTDRVFAADLQELRPQHGQALAAANVRAVLHGQPDRRQPPRPRGHARAGRLLAALLAGRRRRRPRHRRARRRGRDPRARPPRSTTP